MLRRWVSGCSGSAPRSASGSLVERVRADGGTTAIEYALIGSLVFLAIVVAVGLMAAGVGGLFDDAANAF
jgi:Flp pilus assembly pilin Flp